MVLRGWMENASNQTQLFNGIVTHLPQGFKAVKGRLLLLQWLNSYISLIDTKQAPLLIASIFDCITDRSGFVRSEASITMKVLSEKVSYSTLERQLKDRPSPDVKSIHAVIDPLYKDSMQSTERISDASAAESTSNRVSTEMSQSQRKLSNRPGVRILSKPKPGESYKDRFSHVKSSIPKPIPRQSLHKTSLFAEHRNSCKSNNKCNY